MELLIWLQLAVAGNVDFNGDLDVDGTTNLDVVDMMVQLIWLQLLQLVVK